MTTDTSERLELQSLVLVPGLITLLVTALRLVGELLDWAPSLFSREGGGAGALVGIVWLVPIFGAWFGLRLAARSDRPAASALLLRAAAALAGVMGAGFLVVRVVQPGLFGRIGTFLVLSSLAAALAYRAWPALGRVLLAYGLAARGPVLVVMLAAMLGDWGTHYDAAPPDFPAMGPIAKWLLIGVLPQLLLWVPFTLIVGTLAAGLALVVTGRSKPARA